MLGRRVPGYGASIQRSNVTSFTVGAVDTIGVPSVSLLSTPTIGGSSYTYVSGIPYYGPGTTLSFASNSMNFGNIYQTLDPRTVLGRVLRLSIGSTAVDYSHNTVFTNVLTANNRNNSPLSLTISGTAVTSSLNLSGTVYNVNYQGGSTNSGLFTGIGIYWICCLRNRKCGFFHGNAHHTSDTQVALFQCSQLQCTDRVRDIKLHKHPK